MTDAGDADAGKVAQARDIYDRMRQQALDATPLGAIGDWIRAGRAPTAKALWEAGFVGKAPLSNQQRLVHSEFTRRWGYSIPCAEVLAALLRLSPLVEIGAGAGSWSALISAAGGDVVATDLLPEGASSFTFRIGRHFPIVPLSGVEAVRAYPERNIFCSWPNKQNPWALGAVRAMRVGRLFALIGEPRGGRTGTPGLFRYLETRFELVGAIEIPQFPGASDRFTLHRRVR